MHKNNIHNKKYDFDVLTQNSKALEPHVFVNDYQTKTIDFSNPEAVKALNKALLLTHYNVSYWEFPNENLCPPIPGRVDYIHHLSDLLRQSKIKQNIKILDIGTGATCIYPLLGYSIYNWHFVASDIEEKSIGTAQNIVNRNKSHNVIALRFQNDPIHILKGIMKSSEKMDACMCNPPFYKNEEEAFEATKTKMKGLGKENDKVVRNFSGTSKELSYKGGEKAFVHNYLYESSQFKKQCFWFTSLVSNINHVKSMKASLKKLGATHVKVLEMKHGNKISRVVAWTFLDQKEQNDWNKKE